MCLFPSKIPNNTVAYKKGMRYFDCGVCPECMRKRSSSWALRSVYEAREHAHNCMITLTYDKFKYNSKGEIIGEEDVNPDLKVNVSHIQKFIKRLRKHFSHPLKYIACAEYGSTTHRAHYHCILFNVRFNDATFYKRSKRGNPIYLSNTLTKLWSHGICTVDSINVFSGVARYCTKYCAKSRSNDTFMLCSQGIGLKGLLKDFNGKSYYIDGREYPVPRIVWQEYITQCYSDFPVLFSYKYVNKSRYFYNDNLDEYNKASARRFVYRFLRDNNPVYKSYISYWNQKSQIFEQLQDSVINRIYALNNSKYHNYKVAALKCYEKRLAFIPFPSPGRDSTSEYNRYILEICSRLRLPFRHLLDPSRPNMASDTILAIKTTILDIKGYISSLKPKKIPVKSEQISFFS